MACCCCRASIWSLNTGFPFVGSLPALLTFFWLGTPWSWLIRFSSWGIVLRSSEPLGLSSFTAANQSAPGGGGGGAFQVQFSNSVSLSQCRLGALELSVALLRLLGFIGLHVSGGGVMTPAPGKLSCRRS